MSALGLQRALGLGSYKTAWLVLHKLRQAIARPGPERVRGIVEVDETYWGAAESDGATGGRTYKKALIAVAAGQDGQRIARIRMAPIPRIKLLTLLPLHLSAFHAFHKHTEFEYDGFGRRVRIKIGRALDSQRPIWQHPVMESSASSFKPRIYAMEGRKRLPISDGLAGVANALGRVIHAPLQPGRQTGCAMPQRGFCAVLADEVVP